VSTIVSGNVITEPPQELWYWHATLRTFAQDCASPLGVPLSTDVIAYSEKRGAAYRAELRLRDTPPADGCVEVTLVYQVEYAVPAPPAKTRTVTIPVRFTVNGTSAAAPVYRADISVPIP
jgi:hypothetical protein